MFGKIRSTDFNNVRFNNSQNAGAQPIKPSFSARSQFGCDCYENKSQKIKLSKLDMVLAAIATGAVGALALNRFKMGKALNLVGEKIPKTITGRMNKLSDVASRDGMTGLLNKKALMAALCNEHHHCLKSSQNYSVGMLDMDNFKAVNEVFSHHTGDVVLKRIAKNINEVATKHGAKGYRFGGEEFVVTMVGKKPEESKAIMSEIADSIKKDKEIQSLLPEFKKRANDELEYVNPKIGRINTVLGKLSDDNNELQIKDHKLFAEHLVELIDDHIDRFKPSDTNSLEEIKTKLTAKQSDEALKAVLNSKTKIGEDSSMGNELNKILSQYVAAKNDLSKWAAHVDTHGAFTVSGGIISLDNPAIIKTPKTYIEVADAALKAAKVNGKNKIVQADSGVVKSLL